MERVVHPGEFYRHFKNKLYQIITVASHSETGEQMVVYQALYGDYRTYVRPLEMFLSEVDHKKYPEVGQKYRFERVEFARTGQPYEAVPDSAGSPESTGSPESAGSPEGTGNSEDTGSPEGTGGLHATGKSDITGKPTPSAPHTGLLRFLDAATYEERMASLKELEKTAGQEELDSLYVVLDIKPQTGTIAEQVEGIRRILSMQEHYDGGHLR